MIWSNAVLASAKVFHGDWTVLLPPRKQRPAARAKKNKNSQTQQQQLLHFANPRFQKEQEAGMNPIPVPASGGGPARNDTSR